MMWTMITTAVTGTPQTTKADQRKKATIIKRAQERIENENDASDEDNSDDEEGAKADLRKAERDEEAYGDDDKVNAGEFSDEDDAQIAKKTKKSSSAKKKRKRLPTTTTTGILQIHLLHLPIRIIPIKRNSRSQLLLLRKGRNLQQTKVHRRMNTVVCAKIYPIFKTPSSSTRLRKRLRLH